MQIQTRNKILLGVALLTFAIIGVSAVVWHFTKEECKNFIYIFFPRNFVVKLKFEFLAFLDTFDLANVNLGAGLTGAASPEKILGCTGKFIVEPPFPLGLIE